MDIKNKYSAKSSKLLIADREEIKSERDKFLTWIRKERARRKSQQIMSYIILMTAALILAALSIMLHK